MAKQINIAPPPELQGIPRVDFMTPDFDALIWNKGYSVIIEKAISCPCGKRTKEYQTACKNCQGTGWVFINPVETKAVLQSINKSTRYKEWSVELVGTVSVTVENRFQLSYMDKLVVTGASILEVENVLVKKHGTQLYSTTIYPMLKVDYIFLFKSVNEKLVPLVLGTDYTISQNKLLYLGSGVKEGDSVSLRYSHFLQYNVIDLNHDVRNSTYQDDKLKETQNPLPISAIARKTHYIMDALNFEGTNIFDNSIV